MKTIHDGHGWVQIHILRSNTTQSQIIFKYIAFIDFNSNTITNFQFKYKHTAIFYSNTIQVHWHFKYDSNTWPMFPS